MKVLVTGAAGFIGHHVARRLAESRKCEVLGIDHLGDYYDVALKRARVAQLAALEDFRFLQADFADAEKFPGLVAHFQPDYVVHLGAQPGVRHSMENPAAYTRNNLDGFANVLEACRRTPPKHLVFASSSSVYGASTTPPYREDANTDQPISYYGATKKANELMAHSYALNHGVNVTGLRFFSVYGPWGRPDMAPTLFARAILEGQPLKLFNSGKNLRDYTYVDDIVDGLVATLDLAPGFEILNLGGADTTALKDLVCWLADELAVEPRIEYLPAQPGDVPITYADVGKASRLLAYSPKVPIREGLRRFVAWYRERHALPTAGAAVPATGERATP